MEGRKTQGARSVETADESATGSVFLFIQAATVATTSLAREPLPRGPVPLRRPRAGSSSRPRVESRRQLKCST